MDATVLQVLKLVSQDKGGWWTGEKGGRKGLFPSNFVQLLPKLPAAPPLPDRKPPTDVSGTTHDPADLDAATELRRQADKLTEQVTAASFWRFLATIVCRLCCLPIIAEYC